MEEVQKELPNYVGIRSLAQLSSALRAVGAQPFGQLRTSGPMQHSRRPSLWVIDNAAYWRFVASTEVTEEFGRDIGLFHPGELTGPFWSEPVGLVS